MIFSQPVAIENRALRVSETVAAEPGARPKLGLLQSSKEIISGRSPDMEFRCCNYFAAGAKSGEF